MMHDRLHIECIYELNECICDYYFVIFPLGIFNFGNAARAFLVVDLVRAFQCFSASDVSCILCEPFVVKASQLMWYRTCLAKV